MQPQHIAAARTLSEEQYTVAAVHRVAVVVRRVAYQVRTNSSAAQSKHEARIIYIYIYITEQYQHKTAAAAQHQLTA